MEDLTEIKRIWTSIPDGTVPDFERIRRAVMHYRRREMVKTLMMALLMILLGFTMIWVIMAYDSQLLATRIGEGLMISAIIMMLSYMIRTMRRLTSATDLSNDGYLTFLKNEQLFLFRFQKRTQVIGFAAASAGLLLYLYEGVRTSATSLTITYAVALAWIAAAWFVVRPRVMRGKMARLDERIQELERVSQQLNNG